MFLCLPLRQLARTQHDLQHSLGVGLLEGGVQTHAAIYWGGAIVWDEKGGGGQPPGRGVANFKRSKVNGLDGPNRSTGG